MLDWDKLQFERSRAGSPRQIPDRAGLTQLSQIGRRDAEAVLYLLAWKTLVGVAIGRRDGERQQPPQQRARAPSKCVRSERCYTCLLILPPVPIAHNA